VKVVIFITVASVSEKEDTIERLLSDTNITVFCFRSYLTQFFCLYVYIDIYLYIQMKEVMIIVNEVILLLFHNCNN